MTKIEYLYRDRGNYKIWGEATLHENLTETELRARCLDGLYFSPDDWGIPDLRPQLWKQFGYDTDLDHDFHEFIGLLDT